VALLERHYESKVIDEAVARAAAGHGGLVVVEGPAGIGKSRLLAEAVAAAEPEMTVLTAEAFATERDFPFGVTRQLLERAARADRVTWSGPVAAALPVLGLGTAPRASAEDPFAAVHGLYWLCAELAERRPLAVVVDDLQWADEPSCRFLAYVARRVEELAVVIVLALRSGETAVAPELVDDVISLDFARHLRPAPLSAMAVTQLVDEVLGCHEPAFVEACRDVTGGNPFLLHHLLAGVRDQHPDPGQELAVMAAPGSLVRSIDARLTRLGAGPRALARAAAVVGPDAELDLVACLGGLGPDEATGAFDALVAAELLAGARPLRFVHPLVHEAVSAAIGPGEGRAAHGRAADLLHARKAPPERVANQLVQAEPAGRAWAAGVLREAAGDALQSGTPGTAVGLLERALAEPPPEDQLPWVRFELGRAQVRLGAPTAETHLRAALAALADPRDRAQVALELSRVLFGTGSHREAVDLLASLIEALGESAPELAAVLESQLLTAARLDLHVRHLVPERLTIPLRVGQDSPPEHRLAHLAVQAVSDGEPLSKPLAFAEQSLVSGRLLDRASDGVLDVLLVARVLLLCGRFAESRKLLTEVVAQAHERGAVFSAMFALMFRAEVALRAGAIDDAATDADVGRRMLEHVLAPFVWAWFAHLVVEVRVEQAEFDEAEALLAQLSPPGPMPPMYASNPLLWSRGGLHLARGDAAAAAEDLEECGRREEAWGERNPAVIAWRSRLALARSALGEDDEAMRLAAEELKLARRFGAAPPIGVALRVLAVVGPEDRRLSLLEEAVTTLTGSGAALEHARAQVDLGAALRRRGQRGAACDVLREAVDRAHRCGATAVVRRGREELVAAGARPRRPALHGPEALTPSESRIARLAASGLTNTKIAQQLFVTARTVEIHLSHAYRKLSIAGRSELAAALATD
jgi:DNA-binding CsgD family transcriptional regulator